MCCAYTIKLGPPAVHFTTIGRRARRGHVSIKRDGRQVIHDELQFFWQDMQFIAYKLPKFGTSLKSVGSFGGGGATSRT